MCTLQEIAVCRLIWAALELYLFHYWSTKDNLVIDIRMLRRGRNSLTWMESRHIHPFRYCTQTLCIIIDTGVFLRLCSNTLVNSCTGEVILVRTNAVEKLIFSMYELLTSRASLYYVLHHFSTFEDTSKIILQDKSSIPRFKRMQTCSFRS